MWLNKFLIVYVQHFILSMPDYRHINFQRLPHFSILAPIFNQESFAVSPVEAAGAFPCVFGCSR